MIMTPARSLFLILSILLKLLIADPSALLGAQEQAAPRTLLYFADLSEEKTAAEIEDVLVQRVQEEVESLNFNLSRAPQMVFRDADRAGDFRLESFFSSLEDQSADIVIATFYSVEGSNLLIQFTLFDPQTRIGAGGLFTRARIGLTLFSTVNDAVLELRPRLEEYLADRYEYVRPPGRVERIVLRGRQELTTVFIAGREVGAIRSGRLLVPYTPFEVGSLVAMELRKPGYHNRELVLSMDAQELELALPELEPAHHFALQAFWTLGLAQGAGLGLRQYLNPDRGFVQSTLHIHNPVYHSSQIPYSRNFDVSLVYGNYLLFPPGSPLRFSIALGAGVIVSSISVGETGDFTDPYLSLGNPSVELTLPGFQLYLRGELKYTLGGLNSLLGRNWLLGGGGIFPISMGVQLQW